MFCAHSTQQDQCRASWYVEGEGRREQGARAAVYFLQTRLRCSYREMTEPLKMEAWLQRGRKPRYSPAKPSLRSSSLPMVSTGGATLLGASCTRVLSTSSGLVTATYPQRPQR